MKIVPVVLLAVASFSTVFYLKNIRDNYESEPDILYEKTVNYFNSDEYQQTLEDSKQENADFLNEIMEPYLFDPKKEGTMHIEQLKNELKTLEEVEAFMNKMLDDARKAETEPNIDNTSPKSTRSGEQISEELIDEIEKILEK
ncbi:MAG TPA: hypothetical protein DCL21_06440 [Alphaproteobacteria bacterium]|nr:hypothetical protein [Alphaproteobacteria bacterium]